MRTELTSPANPKIKYVVKLRSCSTREQTGEMIVEGFRECRRALDEGYRPKAIFHCPELYLKNENEFLGALQCRLDMGIHYEGWDANDILAYLNTYLNYYYLNNTTYINKLKQ